METSANWILCNAAGLQSPLCFGHESTEARMIMSVLMMMIYFSQIRQHRLQSPVCTGHVSRIRLPSPVSKSCESCSWQLVQWALQISPLDPLPCIAWQWNLSSSWQSLAFHHVHKFQHTTSLFSTSALLPNDCRPTDFLPHIPTSCRFFSPTVACLRCLRRRARGFFSCGGRTCKVGEQFFWTFLLCVPPSYCC